jgi:hypothetical protein
MENSFSLNLLKDFDSFDLSKKNSKIYFLAKKSIKNKFISKENLEKVFSSRKDFKENLLSLKFKSNLDSVFGKLGNFWRMNLEQYRSKTKILICNSFDPYNKPFNPFTKEINIMFNYESKRRFYEKDNTLESLSELEGIPLYFLSKLNEYISLESDSN